MMEAAGVRILDTLNFLPMALSKFPKTFGISEMKKGFFPHFLTPLKTGTMMGFYQTLNFMVPIR